MPVSGAPTTHGIPTFADTDLPDLGAGGLGSILTSLDGVIGGYRIADVTLAAPASGIDFSAIPQTFAHLMVVCYLRGDSGALIDNLVLRFNGDSGANYDYQYLSAVAATVTAADSFGQAWAFCGLLSGGGASANLFGGSRILIPHYSGTANQKCFEATAAAKSSIAGTSTMVRSNTGHWRSAAAINRVTFFPGSGGNFVIGSRATLYGLL